MRLCRVYGCSAYLRPIYGVLGLVFGCLSISSRWSSPQSLIYPLAASRARPFGLAPVRRQFPIMQTSPSNLKRILTPPPKTALATSRPSGLPGCLLWGRLTRYLSACYTRCLSAAEDPMLRHPVLHDNFKLDSTPTASFARSRLELNSTTP